MTDKSAVKISKDHGGKEFASSYHFVGKVKPIRNQEKGTDNWVDVPYYREETDNKGKVKKILEFIIETAESNDLKIKLSGKEMTFVYPYSSSKKKSSKISWEDRFDKTKYPDDTYHYIDSEWDKIDKFKELISTDVWVEVKGKYNPYEFTGDRDSEIKGVSRIPSYINPIIDGKVKIGDELRAIQVNKVDIPYICDLKSPDFVEVNNFKMQIGIRSTYADKEKGMTNVNGVFLTYGKTSSEPKDVHLIVYQQEATEGKKPLADAFESLDEFDFIEVTGQDNNRAMFTWIPIEEKLDKDDPFADVDESNKQTRYEKVTNGVKKGLEITGYIAGSLIREYLTEAELVKAISTTQEDPLAAENKKESFDDKNCPIDFSDDDLPF
ncbi:hypothetical protein [Paenibacillus chitinolyticus]|uniref:hypothetical protein n=1 Tax=Paenibacillus chitinolyticus TaxID=79263 RepID=UPI00366A9937